MTMDGLTLFCLATGAVQMTSSALAIRRAWATSHEAGPSIQGQPPVSILRPICGLENNLERTLESAFALDWPSPYEVVFCVASETDPAISVARRVIERNPHIPARILTGDDRVSVNPKLNNLVKGWKAARYPWIVMADSNVLMPRDYLARLFARWLPGTGMVCSPPVGSDPEGFWAEVECAWLNSYQARWQLVADEIGLGFAQGKTMMLHRGLLDSHGGIERLASEVAEDAASTKIVRGEGLNVRLVEKPFPQPIGHRDWRGIWRRQLRWARLRRDSFVLFFVPELLAGGLLPILAAGTAAALGLWSPVTAAAYAIAWYSIELALIRAYRWPLDRWTPLALLARDIALPALWFAAWFGNGFEWRGNAMSVAHPVEVSPARARIRRAMDKTREKARAIAAFRH
ncbi:glycosyltransferase [Ciceribacter sp. L1K23]|uniref:ceramide glucosyltransferase n=1 Tax=Ciceribacter sp. L1K23 TaxID=2820276 RepID=UPI001B83CE09|nr:ceramide glucosyltransferase [Ciceribacter sp. L1K23]MBR0554743.1 glycosyltransferase [Ciceribacter sp. L1K23]